MKVTVVMDNMAATGMPRPFLAEHGLSLLIETDGRKILMDTGQTGNAVRNLSLLGIHPDDIDTVVISHGHFDHTGGLAEFLHHRRKPVPVYAHSLIFQDRYSQKGEHRRFVGVPFTKAYLTGLGARWHFHDEPVELAAGLWFSGAIPRTNDFEKGDSNLVLVDECDCCRQDQVVDDGVLFYRSGGKLTVISGCAHSGFVNIVGYGCQVTGAAAVRGWIGGTHLGPAEPQQQEQSMAFIETLELDFLAANHCTGFAMMCRLRNMLGDKFIPAMVGTTIDIG